MFLNLVILLCLLFLLPNHAVAHLGGGPPFLRIDGKFAVTNIYNQGAPALTMGWDVPPDTYLVNKPITFELDVPVLMTATTVPQELAKDIKVRWSFATGNNFENKDGKYEEGPQITKTFTQPGSYLTIIEAKLPADSDYILIDTVQVDILPDESYQLPSAYLYAGTQSDELNKNVLLVSEGSADPSAEIASYLWDFGEGSLENGKVINRRFEKAASIGVEPVFHRVVDENGFIADAGFVVENRDGKLQFIPFEPNTKLPVAVGTYEEAGERAGTGLNKIPVPVFLFVSAAIIVLVGGVWWWVMRKKL